MEKIARYNGVKDYECPKFEVEYDILIEDEDKIEELGRNSEDGDRNTTLSNSPPRATNNFSHLIPSHDQAGVKRDGKTVLRDGKTMLR